MRMVTHLEALKEKLDGIQATEEELKTIAAHILALENVLIKGIRKSLSWPIKPTRLQLTLLKSADKDLISYIPEAVGQAIVLLKSTNFSEVHFCLSGGQTWIFFILKLTMETLTYYDSTSYRLSRDVLEKSDLPLREIVQLVCEWLKPTTTDMFTLE